jgi:hypothetical protein
MIIPEKHLDLNHCVLRAGAVLLRHLKKARVASLAKLRERLVQEMKADGEVLFQPTLNFLFLLGRIEYHPEADRIEFLEAARPVTFEEERRAVS